MAGQDRDEDDEASWDIQSDEETLRIALEEARRRYGNEVEFINDVDDRAMRGARTGLIILGILVSVTAYMDPDPATFSTLSTEVRLLGVIGLACVFGSTLFAIGTYTATEYPTGIGDQHRDAALRDGYSSDEWIGFLIEEYGDWTAEVTEMANANARYLMNTMFLQAVGVLSLATAITVAYLNRVEGISPTMTLIALLLVLFLGFWIGALVFWVRDWAGTLLEEYA